MWTTITLEDDVDWIPKEVRIRVEAHNLLASADSKEVEVLQEGRCLCGQPLAEETVILSNSGGNLAVMCSGECFDDYMMMGMLHQITEMVGSRIQARQPDESS